MFFLDLGQYSSPDAGQTFTFMREPETDADWDAIGFALRASIGVPRAGIPTMWLGLSEHKSTSSSFFLTGGRPTFNLQRVEVMPHYYRRGIDDGDTFRSAAFDVRFYWLIPEPTTWLLLAGATLTILMPRRPARLTEWQCCADSCLSCNAMEYGQ
jgi:hypothetical protein